jgi:hypothetical protein
MQISTVFKIGEQVVCNESSSLTETLRYKTRYWFKAEQVDCGRWHGNKGRFMQKGRYGSVYDSQPAGTFP